MTKLTKLVTKINRHEQIDGNEYNSRLYSDHSFLILYSWFVSHEALLGVRHKPEAASEKKCIVTFML